MRTPQSKTLALVLAIVLGMVPLGLGAQTSPDKTTMKDVRREMAETALAIKQYSAEQREEALKRVQVALHDLDARIDSLEARFDHQWEQLDQKARQKGRATLAALRKQRHKVAEWYGGLQHASNAAWEEMKQGFAEAYTALQEAWEKAQNAWASGQ